MVNVELIQKSSSYGFDHSQDNIIKSLHPGGAAEESGKIEIGDKICLVNGKVTSNGDQTSHIIESSCESIILDTIREGEIRTVHYPTLNL